MDSYCNYTELDYIENSEPNLNTAGYHLCLPGVVALLGVPGGLRGVGGGTPVNRLSETATPPTEAWFAISTCLTALRAASPTCAGGLSASTLDSARSSRGSILRSGRVRLAGRKLARTEGERNDEGIG
jgi:hypothetical protein